jgi:hypothetical protein
MHLLVWLGSYNINAEKEEKEKRTAAATGYGKTFLGRFIFLCNAEAYILLLQGFCNRRVSYMTQVTLVVNIGAYTKTTICLSKACKYHNYY